MGMVAIYRISCCGRELIHGRSQGDPMYPPTKKCPFGCPVKLLVNSVTDRRPEGIPDLPKLMFVRFQGEETLTPELRATWPNLEDCSANYWLRNHRLWEKNRALKARTQPPITSEAGA